MNGIIGEFRQGEDISIALDVTSGTTALASSVTASMKPARIVANRCALDTTATPITLNVTAQDPASAGWVITLDHTASAGLAAGLYGIDARMVIGSAVEMTDETAFIRLSQAATA